MSIEDGPSTAEPLWEVAYLFPPKGQWSEGDYLALDTNRLIELSDGNLEILPMPTEYHQELVLFLYSLLLRHVQPERLGKLLIAPFRIRLWEGKFREPDIVFMLARNASKRTNEFWNGADLVVEVVSDDDRGRDLVEKRSEYARAGISEYWIVDPREQTITVLTLRCGAIAYSEAARCGAGSVARSCLLPGFEVIVNDVFQQPGRE